MAIAAQVSAALQNCGILQPTSACIPLPGGAVICPPGGVKIPDPTDLILQLFGQLNAALAPLMPIFRILDVLLAVFECIKAIPKSIFPPNPQPVISCLVHLAEVIAEIVKLIPLVSLPFTIAAFLDALILLLSGIRNNLLRVITQLNRIIALETQAVGPPANPLLANAALCARTAFNAEMAHLNQLFTPLNRLLGVINLFLTLIGQSPLPTLNTLGDDPATAIQNIDPVIAMLQTIRSFIPIPATAP
jgi:hypothetical protein